MHSKTSGRMTDPCPSILMWTEMIHFGPVNRQSHPIFRTCSCLNSENFSCEDFTTHHSPRYAFGLWSLSCADELGLRSYALWPILENQTHTLVLSCPHLGRPFPCCPHRANRWPVSTPSRGAARTKARRWPASFEFQGPSVFSPPRRVHIILIILHRHVPSRRYMYPRQQCQWARFFVTTATF